MLSCSHQTRTGSLHVIRQNPLLNGKGLILTKIENENKHKDLSWMSLEDIRNELETGDYVRLCSRCHGCVHWCMNILGMNWDNINKN